MIPNHELKKYLGKKVAIRFSSKKRIAIGIVIPCVCKWDKCHSYGLKTPYADLLVSDIDAVELIDS